LYEFVVLYGYLGAGKSHALRYLKYIITEKSADEFRSIVLYVERLRVASNTDFMALYRAIMRLLKDDIVRVGAVLSEVIERRVEETWSVQPENIKKRMKKQDFAKTELPNIYSKLSPTYPALPRLITAFHEGDNNAMAILAGGKVKGANPAQYGLDGFIESEYEALQCLTAFINICTRSNRDLKYSSLYKCFYLFIDEFERIKDFPTRNAQSINQGLRDLLNGCPERFCLLLGASAEASEIEAYMEEDVMVRLSRDLIEIPSLDENQAVDFIKEVIKIYRRPKAKVSKTYPFDEEALREIALQTTERTARNLFRACQTVLQKSVLSGRLESNGIITKADVLEFIVM
jgi:energy-coupling factor transporter ATP-binding protein EcfA2